MYRSGWLKEQRRLAEEHEGRIYSHIYDEHWGEIDPVHEQFMNRFLGLCPPGGHILDAPCDTGKYWPLILASGRTVYGIDQSRGMLAQAHAKFPDVPIDKVGLQELSFEAAFDGVVCLDALEMAPPDDWPQVMGNLYRAIRPGSYLYFTVEFADETDVENAFQRGREAGWPVVEGEWVEAEGYHGDWAQEGFYHYYPKMDQVREWAGAAGFRLVDEGVGEEYWHFLARKVGTTDERRWVRELRATGG